MTRRIGTLMAIVAVLCPMAGAQGTITYADLARRLTDVEYLATLPAPGETCAQWSSYDRASRYDEKTGKYVAWDANGDGQGFVREENGQIVMAEMEGPGCIRRIWSAAPGDGHVRIYLDGAAEPAVDLPFKGYFDGTSEPFTRKSLCYEAAKGWDCYVPIPYQKSCKVVADKGWGNYFHFTYTTFPRGTQVPTFRLPLSAQDAAALDAADRELSQTGMGVRGDVDSQSGHLLKAGGVDAWDVNSGPGAFSGIWVKVDNLPPSPGDRTVLRELTISITWDDDPKPSVWAPLGDFFGTAAGANPYASLPSGLNKDGSFYSRWYMPFAKKAHVELHNEGKTDRNVTFIGMTKPFPSNMSIEKLGRFHAKWHLDAFPPAEPERKIDWPMLKTEGVGRFCGVLLHVWNPRGGWWGEGDEKFFVDGEKFPSTFGTGSEDYFGYAWGDPGLFSRPYHNQVLSMNNAGHIAVNRWHINDNVPFQKSFEGCIEKYFPNSRPTLYACTAFWYLAPGGKDPYGPVPLADRLNWPEPVVKRLEGVIECEKMTVLSKTAGTTQEQAMDGFGDAWSGGAQLWWTEAKPGAKLDLRLEVAKAGSYTLTVQLTKAPDYGIVQVYVDGEKAGSPIDLYSEGVAASGVVDLGVQKLEKGDHKLTFEITGTNPKAKPAYMVGLDYVKLEPSVK
ncbi:MAG: DUF2961 domain-containing protein [Candidatus Hydrogenedentes bacterium]|nr:DUF2961 domain-containing protein [Candidatus Hydrogenedentota bacterium]